MAEFVFAKEKSVKVGEKVGVQSDRQIPFDVIVDGDNKKVAFNQDGEYLVSVFNGNITVTALKYSK